MSNTRLPIAFSLCLGLASVVVFAEDLHQVQIPQQDDIAIEPDHLGDVIANPNRASNRAAAIEWYVTPSFHRRALMPEDEAALLAEEKSALKQRALLHFRFNQSSPISWGPLLRDLDLLRVKGVRIHVVGHTDEVGSARYNYALSYRRARTVSKWLVFHGVPRAKISIEGKGKRQLIQKGNGAKNRRASMSVVFTDEAVKEIEDE